ncbi:MAG: lauroyl acyltransferase [Pseudomonadota bacterium]
MTKDNASQIALPQRRSNRPVTLAHRFEFAVVVILMGLFRLLGVDRASAFSGYALRFLGPKLRSISKRGETNLRLIFPDWNERQVRDTISTVWENLGRTAAEYAHLDQFTTQGEAARIQHRGVEKILHLKEDPGRAVFVTGHFANWEIAGIVAQELGLEFGFVYRALNNPLIDEMIIKKRGAVTTRRQIPKGVAGARPMIDLLKDGLSIAFLADQKLNTGGISVPFMGHKAMTAPAAARIAVRFNLPVVPITTERADGARFNVEIHSPIDFTPTGDLLADVEALTIKINEALEAQIRKRPGEWLWFHRRWPKETYARSGLD